MSTILSARYVCHSRRRYYCDWCGKPFTKGHIRLYGRADYGDPMNTLRLHPGEPCCPTDSGDPKVAAALAKANKQ